MTNLNVAQRAMNELRTNRGLVNEWLWARWCLLLALTRGLFTLRSVWVYSQAEDTIAIIEIEGQAGQMEIVYEYGKEP